MFTSLSNSRRAIGSEPTERGRLAHTVVHHFTSHPPYDDPTSSAPRVRTRRRAASWPTNFRSSSFSPSRVARGRSTTKKNARAAHRLANSTPTPSPRRWSDSPSSLKRSSRRRRIARARSPTSRVRARWTANISSASYHSSYSTLRGETTRGDDARVDDVIM